MFFNSVKKINRLRKEIKRLLGKGMPNIYLKVFIEKKRRTRNFNFKSLKNSSPGQFLGTSNSRRYQLLQLKNQRSESKTVCGFSIIFILKRIMTF